MSYYTRIKYILKEKSMKRVVVLVVALVLVFSLSALPTLAADTVMMWNLGEYGQKTHIFGAVPETPPVADGIISENEYCPEPCIFAPSGTSTKAGNYIETAEYFKLYMSEDSDYFYGAVETKIKDPTYNSKFSFDFGFNLNGSAAGSSDRYSVVLNNNFNPSSPSTLEESRFFNDDLTYETKSGGGAFAADKFAYQRTATENSTTEIFEFAFSKSVVKSLFKLDTFSNTFFMYCSQWITPVGSTAHSNYGTFRYYPNNEVKALVMLDYGKCPEWIGNVFVLGTESDLPYPVEEETTTAEEVTTPAEEETTPAEEVTTPAGEETTTAEEVTTPTEEVTTPSGGEVTTKDDDKKPGCKSSFSAIGGLLTIGTASILVSSKKRKK
jgi:hypothetical protein